MELDVASRQYVFRISGKCPICEASTEFIANSDKQVAERWLLNSHAKCNAGIDRSCNGSEV
jgi:hypothetical protein